MIEMMRVRLDVDRTVKLNSLKELAEVLTDLGLSGSAQEQLWVVAVDGINQIRSITPVAVGTYHDCFVALPTVFSPVLLSACDRFTVAHNHPNGRLMPTADDLDLTRRIETAAKVMDMEFDDHIIVGPTGGFTSMRALGHLT